MQGRRSAVLSRMSLPTCSIATTPRGRRSVRRALRVGLTVGADTGCGDQRDPDTHNGNAGAHRSRILLDDRHARVTTTPRGRTAALATTAINSGSNHEQDHRSSSHHVGKHCRRRRRRRRQEGRRQQQRARTPDTAKRLRRARNRTTATARARRWANQSRDRAATPTRRTLPASCLAPRPATTATSAPATRASLAATRHIPVATSMTTTTTTTTARQTDVALLIG